MPTSLPSFSFLLLGIGAVLSMGILAMSASFPWWDAPSSFLLSTTTPNTSQLKNADIVPNGSLVFRYGIGSGLYGYDTLEIHGNGQGRFQYCERCFHVPQWQESRFQLSPDTVAKLCEKLREVDFAQLPDSYHANAVDGEQIVLTLRIAGQTKRVYCNNRFPAAVRSLVTYIDQQVLATVHNELNRGQPIDQEEVIDLFATRRGGGSVEHAGANVSP